MLASAETALKRAREAAAGQIGELRLATIGPAIFSFLPACLARFRAAIAEARVTVMEMAPSEQLGQIARGDIHVGISGAHSFPSSPVPGISRP